MLRTSIGRLRVAGWLEGSSLLVLMGIAMPLKYLAGRPRAVEIVGWIHGVLFVVYSLLLLEALLDRKWPLRRAALLFIAAFLPFGTFVVDGRLRREERLLVDAMAER
jgi:integral membrane protein